MKAFNHVNASTVDQAVEILKGSEGLGKPIAGGTDLIGVLKDRILPTYPETVVNLKTIRGLDYIREDSEGLKIGALTRLAEIVESPIVRKRCPLLAEAAHSVASPQIRNLATIGGNLAQEVRCWYYRYPNQIGGRILCARKGGDGKEAVKGCSALMGDNRYHSIYGAVRVGKTPCTEDCPAGADIPSYLSKIREGDLKGAACILLDANPLPAITGRVCPQFCLGRCNRVDVDDPVSTRNIERFMGDYILGHVEEFMNPPEVLSGRRVAVVGSGPAGLSAAFYLRRAGHQVVVFDRLKEPGGMLAHSIPSFRLPRDIVRRLVAAFKGMGIEFLNGVQVGKDVDLDELRGKFDRIFLATGAWTLPSLGIAGEGSARHGLEFLVRAKEGINEVSGRRVLVIGGGNVAMDSAITALRQGAKKVVVACLESREEMPASEAEIEKAIEEGVKLMPTWGPSRILEGVHGGKEVELIRCSAVFDNSGNFAPRFDDAVQERIETDQVIMAVGQRPDLSFADERYDFKVNRGLLPVDHATHQTTMPDVFAGGDLTTGASTVAQAVRAGRTAALAIDRSLSGSLSQAEEKGARKEEEGTLLAFHSSCLRPTSPISVPERPQGKRNLEEEDTLGLELSEAKQEADRCLNCGCVAVSASDIAPVLMALDATIKTTKRTMPAATFFSAMESGPRLLADDELITEIGIPDLPDGAKCEYKKFRTRKSVDFPIVSLATVFQVEAGVFKDVRIALGAVAPVPMRVVAAEEFLKGKAPQEQAADAAAALALEKAIPLSGNAYKVQILKTLIKRAIISARVEAKP